MVQVIGITLAAALLCFLGIYMESAQRNRRTVKVLYKLGAYTFTVMNLTAILMVWIAVKGR